MYSNKKTWANNLIMCLAIVAILVSTIIMSFISIPQAKAEELTNEQSVLSCVNDEGIATYTYGSVTKGYVVGGIAVEITWDPRDIWFNDDIVITMKTYDENVTAIGFATFMYQGVKVAEVDWTVNSNDNSIIAQSKKGNTDRIIVTFGLFFGGEQAEFSEIFYRD